MRFPSALIFSFLLSGSIVPTVAVALTVSSTFDVTATIQKGCVFGTSTASSQPNMGTLNFGTRSATATNVDVASTSGGGSIIATCTPGTNAIIELGYGTNGGSSAQRYLKNAAGTRLLAYQLYRDAARTQVWGTGSLALSIVSFPTTTQTYTVYARYFGGTPLPPAGVYTDNVTVSLTY
ncbi:Csu type fimbrial protein [Pectobacterium polaris]|uniref:Csu type fimbrial protein n=1 Tax=Pectobacterium polaris TaxID=2042057 RepID=UPI0032E4D773